ncbi:MAG: nitroreductase family protein [Verrucomicrobiota bacterium]
MNFLDLVRRRQSDRKYAPRAVPRELIDRCLEAARLAPSACNSQPWSFIVVDTDAARRTFAEAAFSGLYAMNAFAREAPVFIVAVTERSKYVARLGGQFRGVQYSLVDIGIACEHLCLQAAEEGLGTCWLGWFNEKGVKQALGLPRDAKVDIIISMGYPAEDGVREKQRKTLDEIRRYKE